MFLVAEDSTLSLPLNIKICDNFFTRLVGALRRGYVRRGEAYLFPGCSWPHTWFMRRAISILFYDQEGKIVEFYPSVPPFRFLKPVAAAGMIELNHRRLTREEVAKFKYIRFSRKVSARLQNPVLRFSSEGG